VLTGAPHFCSPWPKIKSSIEIPARGRADGRGCGEPMATVMPVAERWEEPMAATTRNCRQAKEPSVTINQRGVAQIRASSSGAGRRNFNGAGAGGDRVTILAQIAELQRVGGRARRRVGANREASGGRRPAAARSWCVWRSCLKGLAIDKASTPTGFFFYRCMETARIRELLAFHGSLGSITDSLRSLK